MARVKKLPKGFYLGAATAAYQVEGATQEDGRGQNTVSYTHLTLPTILLV